MPPLPGPPCPAVAAVKPGTGVNGVPAQPCANTLLPNITKYELRRTFFDTVAPAEVTVGSTYAKCSMGATTFSEGTSQVNNQVNMPCSGYTS